MPYKLAWYEPAHTIFIQFDGYITFAEAVTSNNEEVELLDQASHKNVFFLVDLRYSTGQEASLSQLRDSLNILKHQKLKYVVVVKPQNLLVAFLNTAMLQLFRVNYQLCDSLTEAAHFVQSQCLENEAFGNALDEWLHQTAIRE